jgi:DNA-binding NarL/FixJ family response regulator
MTIRKYRRLPPALIKRIRALKSRGYTHKEIAAHLGVSTGTVSNHTREAKT